MILEKEKQPWTRSFWSEVLSRLEDDSRGKVEYISVTRGSNSTTKNVLKVVMIKWHYLLWLAGFLHAGERQTVLRYTRRLQRRELQLQWRQLCSRQPNWQFPLRVFCWALVLSREAKFSLLVSLLVEWLGPEARRSEFLRLTKVRNYKTNLYLFMH